MGEGGAFRLASAVDLWYLFDRPRADVGQVLTHSYTGPRSRDDLAMKHLLTTATLSAPILLGGCSGAYWGNLAVLCVSVGVFYGTLSLGRTQAATRSQADDASRAEPR